MFAMVKSLLSLLLLVSVAVMPIACVNVNRDRRHEEPKEDVNVGGKYGVTVDRSGSGTDVTVGGDHGVVVGHPRHGEDEGRR
jgi:hypothetical protein